MMVLRDRANLKHEDLSRDGHRLGALNDQSCFMKRQVYFLLGLGDWNIMMPYQSHGSTALPVSKTRWPRQVGVNEVSFKRASSVMGAYFHSQKHHFTSLLTHHVTQCRLCYIL